MKKNIENVASAKCDCPGCHRSQIDALQERLGAAYFDIEKMAKDYNTTVGTMERWISRTCREHNLDLVEAGLEQVGPGPHFISRPLPNGMYYVKLYSLRPEAKWKFELRDYQ
jgi:hypothetical protein